MNENNLAPPAAKAAVAAAVVSKPLNDSKPEFSRGISLQYARDNKTFGTVKSFRINPNARPKINIYADNPEQMHQAVKTGVVKVNITELFVVDVFNRTRRQSQRQLSHLQHHHRLNQLQSPQLQHQL